MARIKLIRYGTNSIRLVWRDDRGSYHRADGPAVIWDDQDKWYYLEGTCVAEREFNERAEQ